MAIDNPKHRNLKKQICLLVILALLLIVCTACTEEERITHGHNVDHEETITVSIGETYQLTPRYLPEGEYVWSSGTGHVTVDENGLITAVDAGDSRLTAQLKIDNIIYLEFFFVHVPVDQGEIYGLIIETNVTPHTGVTEYPMLIGEKYPVTVTLDAENPILDTEDQYVWESSDPEIASVEGYNYQANKPDYFDTARITAHAPGKADITVRYKGVENTVHVTVLDPETVSQLEILKTMAYFNVTTVSGDKAYVIGGINDSIPISFDPVTHDATIRASADDVELLHEIASNPQGKYAVLMTVNFAGTDLDGVYNENTIIDYNAMSLLPPELLPYSMSEVEYVIAIDFRAEQVSSYENGTKAMLIYAESSIKDAKTGRVIRSLSTRQGEYPPNYIHYGEGNVHEYAYGSFAGEKKRQMMTEALTDLWQREYGLEMIIMPSSLDVIEAMAEAE